MGLLARFEYGARKFPLNDGRITIGEGYVPPATVIGLVAGRDRFSGQVYDRQAKPREWEWTVHVETDSETEAIRILTDLQNFLNQAGNRRRPLYFAARNWGEDYPFEPVYGQFGKFDRVKVLSGEVGFGEMYEAIYDGAQLIACPIRLTIDPYSYGLRQAFATAEGAIFDEWHGYSDRRSRGLRLAPVLSGYENKVKNPVFGYSTWDQNWTAEANILASQATDEEDVLFGYSAARLLAKGSTNNAFYTSINVGNTNTHCMSGYIRLKNNYFGDALDAGLVELRYGGSALAATRYMQIEDGWWYVYGKFTGIASSQACGVIVQEGIEIILAGFQVEQSSFPSPISTGEMYGHSWSGTAHNSETARAASGTLLTPVERHESEGAIQIVVRCMAASADLAVDTYYVLNDANDDFSLTYNTSTGKWSAGGGGTTLVTESVASTFAFGDVFVFQISWGEGAFNFWINGTLVGTDTFSPTSSPLIYLGSDIVGAQHGPWLIMVFDVYPARFQTAVAAEFYAQVSAGLFLPSSTTEDVIRQLGTIPWFWTKDGDNVLDNVDDTNRDNWGLAGGVPGTAEAETEWLIEPSNAAKAGYWLMRKGLELGRFQYPSAPQFYQDRDGSADANASNGAYEAAVGASVTFGLGASDQALMAGVQHFFFRGKITSAQDMLVTAKVYMGNGRTVNSETRRIAMTTSYKWFYIGTTYAEYPDTLADKDTLFTGVVALSSVSGLSVTVHGDVVMVIPGAVLRVMNSPLGAVNQLVVAGREVYGKNASGILTQSLVIVGQEINLLPDKQNLVWFVLGDDGEAHTITETAEFTQIVVRPRWWLQ